MKKNILTIILLFVLFLGGLYVCFFSNSSEKVLVNYNGNSLRVSIDGLIVSQLPTADTYYLTNYSCDNESTEVIWDKDNYELVVSNGKAGGGVSCNLTFKSKPLLSEMPVGSYVAYEGIGGKVGKTNFTCKKNGSASLATATDATEAPNSCLGQNAREDLDTSGYTYGYCYSAGYKYYTTGWRIAYIDTTNNKAVIVSAGSPECNTRTSSTANATYIKTANALALKYCNPDYVDGDCTCTDKKADGLCNNPSTDAWAINDNDFYNITKAISGVGKRLTIGSSSLGDSGGTLGSDLYCIGNGPYQECGYNNSLIDNGGYYWFAARFSSSDMIGVFRDPSRRYVISDTGANAYGLRPVISLSSSVFVTGGDGTMDNPYIIENIIKNEKITYTISYNANGGSGAPSSQTKIHGQPITLSSTTPSKTGHTFGGWALSASGPAAYIPGATYIVDSDVTLWAVWNDVS